VPVGTGGVIHINVNCTDLSRSMAFYRDKLGLRTISRTSPTEPQDGTAFGLETAQWDAWMMGGPDGFAAPVIDLLQWMVPPPVPRPGQSTAGFRRLHIGSPEGSVREITDPDGTPVAVKDAPVGLVGVTIGCTDLDRSRRFYEEIVDLGKFVTLVEARGAAPASANTVGIWRMALATEDIEADVDWLGRAGVPCRSGAVELGLGPGLPSVRFMLFSDPDGTTLELIERPRR
jgi:catechol 2,3-dioxygenase-like lactoylglutathione lyase family enzyme